MSRPPPALKVAASPPPPADVAAPVRRLVLLGFTPAERHQLETVFRLAASRLARYRLVADAADADVAVADADNATAMDQLHRRGLPAVLVGTTEHAGPARLARPINVAQVVRSLDQLARRAGPPPPVQRVLDELAHLAGVPPVRPRARVLVAVAEQAANRLLLAPLQQAGCEVVRARSGAEAIERARAGELDLVVIDAGLDGLDGYHACRTIKRRAEAEGRTPPPVVLISAGPLAVNRVRAEMAGADRLLEAPLDGEALLALLPSA